MRVQFYCHSSAKIPIGYVQQGKTCNTLLLEVDDQITIDTVVVCPVCKSDNHVYHSRAYEAFKVIKGDSE